MSQQHNALHAVQRVCDNRRIGKLNKRHRAGSDNDRSRQIDELSADIFRQIIVMVAYDLLFEVYFSYPIENGQVDKRKNLRNGNTEYSTGCPVNFSFIDPKPS